MPADPDQHRLQSTVNDLNNLLQVIAESSTALEPICSGNSEAKRYFNFLRTGLERAKLVTAELASRIGGQERLPEPAPKPAPQPIPNTPATIENPNGSKELICRLTP